MESTKARQKTVDAAREVARAEEKVEVASRFLKKIQTKHGITSGPELQGELAWPTQGKGKEKTPAGPVGPKKSPEK
jgi:capsule polysaccharide export protein KpsE/RkpR